MTKVRKIKAPIVMPKPVMVPPTGTGIGKKPHDRPKSPGLVMSSK